MTESTGVRQVTRVRRTEPAEPSGETSLVRVESLGAAPLGPRHTLVAIRLKGGAPESELLRDDGSLRDERVPVTTVDAHAFGALSNGAPTRLVVGVVRAGPDEEGPVPVTLVNDTVRKSFPRESLEAAATDLRTLLREELVGLDPEARERLMAFLSEAVPGEAGPGSLSLSRGLARVRDALREPAPVRVRSRDELQGLHIDAIHAVDEHGFWIRGWMIDRDAPVVRLTAHSPEGHRVDLLTDLYRFPRPDLAGAFGPRPPGLGDRDETGFVVYAELPASSRLAEGWLLEMENELGVRTECAAPTVVSEGLAVRDAILRDLSLEPADRHELKVHHARPALERLQHRLAGSARIHCVDDHGTGPDEPEVTIVVPLYRRLDFLELQLAHFVHDPEIGRAELIYVLDSPEQTEELAGMAPALHALYRVPFRVVYLEQNVGFSGANNAGAAYARGRRLLFLNSDVVPSRPGWLGRMLAAYDETPGIGALGPKLLYEDDSLQHAGLYFERQPTTGLWENAHYYKGLHRSLAAAGVARRVPAVTGACLLIDADLYREQGGFRGMYVQGDYEDSDLCLRVMEAGRSNWYLPEVELYHLEAQSYPDTLRRSARDYNMWLHTHLWGETIESVMSETAFQDLRAPLGGTA